MTPKKPLNSVAFTFLDLDEPLGYVVFTCPK